MPAGTYICLKLLCIKGLDWIICAWNGTVKDWANSQTS